MSAKKSFDIGREKPTIRKKASRTVRKQSSKKLSAPTRAKRLRERREQGRVRMRGFVLGAFFLLCGLLVYGLWRDEVRIQHVEASTVANSDAIEALTKEAMEGARYYVIPNNSFFFYPEEKILHRILDAYPRIASLEITRNGFTGLTISAVDRNVAFLWCGLPSGETFTECYETDEHGFIFAKAQMRASTSPLLLVRGEIDNASTTNSYPLRARVIGFETLPQILSFVGSLEAFGTPLTAVSIRGDEVDLFAESGTRITYVLGQEVQALKDARAALPTLNLMDGSLEYVDLRFDGKVYLKRKQW
jgi:hypothetical protein